MKILIISHEVWSENNNGGNVLSNIFSDFDAEFAQIYCSPGKPNNKLCKKYFQITDKMIVSGLFRNQKIGERINYKDFPSQSTTNITDDVNDEKWYFSIFKKYRLSIFTSIREILWKFSSWKSNELEDFILDFKPDVIFAPCYSHIFMLRMNRYVKKIADVNMISYISDDSYSLRQISISPFYWINRLLSRAYIKKTFKDYSLVYTMTEEQSDELENSLKANMRILRKGADFSGLSNKTVVNNPIRIVYAGGIYINRWKILATIGEVLQKINKDNVRIRLDIYTQNSVTQKQTEVLNDGRTIFLHSAVNQKELLAVYNSSDIALHVESFDLKYRLITRLSFSTKIVDCLASRCAVMAISWKEHAGLMYLRKNDAAICIDDLSNLYNTLIEIVDNPEYVIKYADKAWACGKNNHGMKEISVGIYDDFLNYIK
jgi:hypothetical protein